MNGVDIFPQSRAGTARNVNETGFPPEGGGTLHCSGVPTSRPRSFVTWGCWRVGPTRMVRVVNAEGVLPRQAAVTNSYEADGDSGYWPKPG